MLSFYYKMYKKPHIFDIIYSLIQPYFQNTESNNFNLHEQDLIYCYIQTSGCDVECTSLRTASK